MNAEIYVTGRSDVTLGATLAEGLRRHLHPGITVKLLELGSGEREVIETARRYVKLLQASIRPDKGFQLNLTVLEHFGYRFYIYVYYAFSYYAAKKIEGLQDFLPAVAVHNRMALVPAGLGRALERDWSDQLSSPFQPLDMGGVAEVDFRDAAAVEGALAEVGRATRGELLADVRAWASFRVPGEVDLTALAKDLDVDLGFLHHLLKSQAGQQAVNRRLTCLLEPRKIAFGRWTRVELQIRNDSDVSLKDLQVTISGPVEIRPSRLQLDVAAGETAMLPLSLKPTDHGEYPLEVVLALPDEQVFGPWLPVEHLWIESD